MLQNHSSQVDLGCGTSEVEHCWSIHSKCAPAAIRPGDERVNVRAAAAAAHNPTRIYANDRQVLRLCHWMHDEPCRQLKPCTHCLRNHESSLGSAFLQCCCMLGDSVEHAFCTSASTEVTALHSFKGPKDVLTLRKTFVKQPHMRDILLGSLLQNLQESRFFQI